MRNESVLVVAPVHREGQKAAACIRAELRKEGLLGAKDHLYSAFRNLQWTDAEKADLANYHTGLVVQMEQNGPGFKRGARFRVMRSENGRVWLRGDDGRDLMLPVQYTDRFNVYEPFALPVAAGDKIRVTHNGETLDGHKLSNGKIYDVKRPDVRGRYCLDERVAHRQGFRTRGHRLLCHVVDGTEQNRRLCLSGAERRISPGVVDGAMERLGHAGP